MNKRTWVIVAALLVALTSPSLAATHFDYFKMVGAAELGNSSLSQTNPARATYGLNETPYLYYHVTPAPTVTQSVLTLWFHKAEPGVLVPDTATPADTESWLSLSNWNSLSDEQKLGDWRVTGFLKQGRTLLDCKTVSFVVTPEPMAMVLYGIGGLPLAAHFLRRRKQIAA